MTAARKLPFRSFEAQEEASNSPAPDDHVGTTADVAQLYARYPFAQDRPRRRRRQRLEHTVRTWLHKLAGPQTHVGYPHPEDRAPALDIDRIFAHVGRVTPSCKILDAGCGSGWVAAHLARIHPQHEVTAIDLVPAHIETCKRNYAGPGNLRFLEADITRVDQPDVLGDERFDAIVCTGVLHQMPQPERGLAALRGVLANDGIMLLYLYDVYARQAAHLLRRAVYLLAADEAPPRRLEVAKSLLKAVRGQARFAQLHREDMLWQADAILADTLTHPVEYTYSLPQVQSLVEAQDLELVGLFDFQRTRTEQDPLLDHRYYLERLLEQVDRRERPSLEEAFERLAPIQRLHLLQLLCDRHTFRGLTVICARKGVYRSGLW